MVQFFLNIEFGVEFCEFCMFTTAMLQKKKWRYDFRPLFQITFSFSFHHQHSEIRMLGKHSEIVMDQKGNKYTQKWA